MIDAPTSLDFPESLRTNIVLQKRVQRREQRVLCARRNLLEAAKRANLVLGIFARLQFKCHFNVRRVELGRELLLGAWRAPMDELVINILF